MWTAILQVIIGLIIPAVEAWIRSQKHQEELWESYYKFLEALDKAGMKSVSKRLNARDAESELKKRIRSRRSSQ